ncbi:hypothetical protein JCM18918_2400 [Cutibacterium acnes JCM 18918]|nr:hypothetical protein JCM18918_2400 [Cutibacterium acnes JCM 18918]
MPSALQLSGLWGLAMNGAYDMCAEHAEALSRRWGGKSSACPVSTIQPQTHQPMI